MNVKLENIEKNVVQLEIEVEADKFEESMKKAFQKNAKRFNIPGFRKGKAPRSVVERYYGEEVLYEDAINIAFPEAYDKAVEENNLHPVDRPEIDIKQIGKDKNLIFTAKVTLKPDVELGEYFGVEVKKVTVNVTDEDVEKELNKEVEKNARLITVEDRGIKSGDNVNIDFEGSIDGVLFEGGTAAGYDLVIGSNTFIPGFEDQLIDAKVGDEVDVNVNFPEDYGKDDLAGKPALFKVKINEIKEKELPTVDDEFAKDVSEFETLAEYKEDIKKKLLHEAEHKAEHQLENSVIDKVVENAAVDIPEVMFEKHIDSLVRDFDMRLRYQGLDVKRYQEMMGMDDAAFRGQFRKRAENEVKTQLVLEKISKVETIEVSDEDYAEEVKSMAKNYNQNEEDFKKHLREDDIEYIKDNLKIKKLIDLMVEKSKQIEE